MHALFEQARENRGREVELVWQVPSTYKTYTILIKFDRVTPQPLWQVWEDNGRENKMVWRFETADINMIYDVIAMLEVTNQKTTGTVQSVSQPQPGTAPSAAAFPQHNPRSTGSFQALAQTSQSVNKGIVGSSGASGTFSTSGTYSTQPPQPRHTRKVYRMVNVHGIYPRVLLGAYHGRPVVYGPRLNGPALEHFEEFGLDIQRIHPC